MVGVTTGALALPIPDDSDPMGLLPETVRDMASQLELNAIPAGLGFTGTWDATTGSVSLGTGGDSRAFYFKSGQTWVRAVYWWRFGTSPSFGSGSWRVLLPKPAFTPAGATRPIQFSGMANYYDDSANANYGGQLKVIGGDATRARLMAAPDVGAGSNQLRNVDATTPFAFGVGDEVFATIEYLTDGS